MRQSKYPRPLGERHVDPRSRQGASRVALLAGMAVVIAVVTALVAGLLVNMAQRRWEAQHRAVERVELTEDTIDPAVWGRNYPHQYDSYRRTVDYERTRHGGSDAIPVQKLDKDPWLRTMWAGYAFSLDYREARGHAYMLHDQDHTERILQRSQPGACLHCHSSVLPAYRFAGEGDVMAGFHKVNAMTWNEARNMTDDEGVNLVTHPVTCVDCHNPATMNLRVTRPGFLVGIAALAEGDDPVPHLPSIERWRQGRRAEPYDPNELASRQEMRTFACAQCHVEYYFTPQDDPRGRNQLVYPWHNGLRVEQIEAYYDEIGYSDWTHALTGGGMLKAQHPEFEVWSQGIHAQAGVSCADCHMPYQRVGALKVSDHHVRSPLLHVNRACQTCHNVPESELLRRAHTIQDRTYALSQRASAALMDQIGAMVAAREALGAEEALANEQYKRAIQLQRSAQWRIDFVYSENSHGFHASQETARILAEAIDYARQGETLALSIVPGLERRPPPAGEVEGATPAESTPPGPIYHPAEERGQLL